MEQLCIVGNRFVNSLRRIGIDPLQLFLEYDKQKSGQLTPEIFRRALTSANFWLEENDFALICANYLEGRKINYKRFCEDIAQNGKLTQTYASTSQKISKSDLLTLGSHLNARGINLFDIFSDYDKVRIGKISVQTFFRGVGNNQVTQSIVKAYALPNNEINYVQLQRDIEDAINQRTEKALPSESELPSFFIDFARLLSMRNINVQEECLNHDHLRSGKLQPFLFLSVLSSFQLPLTPSQMQQISETFLDGNLVDYRLLCKCIQRAQNTLTSFTNTEIIPDCDENIPIDSIIEKIRDFATNHRLKIDSILELGDPQHSGFIQRSIFYRLMSFEGIHFSNQEIKSLDKEFCTNNNYNLEKILTQLYPKVIHVDDCGKAVIERLKSFLEENKVRISPHFHAYDRENSGSVSINQMISVFSRIGFQMSKFELNQIIRKYQRTITSLKSIPDLINYEDLCSKVEPPLPKVDYHAIALEQSKRVISKNLQPSQTIIDLLEGIHSLVSTHKMDFRTLCSNQDNIQMGTISINDLKNILRMFRIKTESNQVKSLIEFYKTNGGQICYSDMCDDMDTAVEKSEKEKLYQTKCQQEKEQLNCSILNRIDPKLKEALIILKLALENKRADILDLFQELDHNKTGFVYLSAARPILISAIQNFQILSEEQMKLIENGFRGERQTEMFSYRRLCAALGDIDLTSEELNKTRNHVREQNQTHQIVALLNTIRNKLASRKIKVLNLFAGMKNPYISEQMFKEAIDFSNIIISDDEYQILFTKYETPQGILWRQFCTDVERTRLLLINLDETL